ncbi:MAG: hypothetical protein R2769_05760 [Saprospiraceae bacterium]
MTNGVFNSSWRNNLFTGRQALANHASNGHGRMAVVWRPPFHIPVSVKTGDEMMAEAIEEHLSSRLSL